MVTTVFEALSRKQQYKYPYIFLGCYLTFMLATVCLANKLTVVGNMILPGGIFVFPFTFGICDVVGEVYGYAYPRLFILNSAVKTVARPFKMLKMCEIF
jgi:uncharacterized PurR-regulated membrane protein YhhQ (DUF165 family)